MSDPCDDTDEMTPQRLFTDRDVDAVLLGHATTDDLDPLTTFVADVRRVAADQPAQASAALSTLFESGIFPADILSDESLVGIGRRARVATTVAGLSLTAKLLLMGGIAAAAAGGAAAAGVLPDAAQNAAASFVRTVTPFEIPHNDHADDRAPDTVPDTVPAGAPGSVEVTTPEQGEVGRPTAPGQNGLDTANSTPAAEHAPDSVPAVTAPGRPSATAPGQGPPDSLPVTVPSTVPTTPTKPTHPDKP